MINEPHFEAKIIINERILTYSYSYKSIYLLNC